MFGIGASVVASIHLAKEDNTAACTSFTRSILVSTVFMIGISAHLPVLCLAAVSFRADRRVDGSTLRRRTHCCGHYRRLRNTLLPEVGVDQGIPDIQHGGNAGDRHRWMTLRSHSLSLLRKGEICRSVQCLSTRKIPTQREYACNTPSALMGIFFHRRP